MKRAIQIDSRTACINKAQFWTDRTSEVIFSNKSMPADPLHFCGKLTKWELGDVWLSYFSTDPIRYVRQGQHIRHDKEEQVLITFSASSDLKFNQNGLSLTCRKNQYFIEMTNHPYEFTQTDAGDIWVLCVSSSHLRGYVRSIEKFAPYTFDGSQGVGGLLFDLLRMLPLRLSESPASTHQGLGHTLMELLALSLEGNDRVLGSHTNSVKKGHLARAERFIRTRLSNHNLTPELVAAECGISTSYLHQLFRSSGISVGRWIRELRLVACDNALRNSPSRRDGIAEIAYRYGFNDHAQFCRLYKAHFGRTPSESRDLSAPIADSASPLSLELV
ncbi:MAG: helix-turn-helix domain-containing protein [Mesorhizobium sp.]|uniref:helix-turn-helix domain-containing protein n=1 Tax=Mesorhizobium sp. TaxID=1871066 RepID=UPI001221D21A|nr:helix-turn-helix domain-containing protein [Mesorhizobium sp.]TIU71930.1 MAG: helix-turn-helix domain-containing protein [Mesorhizobium sp.]TIW14140.1 MAG: helix-turn-helix domain-containing protein [Mesorhizobium sp.]TIW71458.1 MAG: helix-turn-helix domain-containing protein [Mesorhizobium sp.]TIX73415.1 MAG: helix-turn-helix domain-containing protein [Mesorhizobium sp.]